MNKTVLRATVAAAFVVAAGTAYAASCEGMKAYQVSSGTLTLDKSGLTKGVDVGKMFTIPVAMYIIDHPRGVVVFDTGNADDVSGDGCEGYWGKGLCDAISPKQSRGEVIDRQLEKFGYSTDDVKYVVYSHFHLDHAGNIELFPKATHVVQRKELEFAWWPEKWFAGAYVMKDYDESRDYNYWELAGDFDLFGDGCVTALTSPGHTRGHQSVMVRLDKTGAVIFAGDAIYTTENLNGVPLGYAVDVSASEMSRERLKMIRDQNQGEIWFSHDPVQYDSHDHKLAYE